MPKIFATLTIPDDEVRITFVRSGGPGGQHVNKVATTALLQFDYLSSPSLPEESKELLREYPDSRIGKDGTITIRAGRYRSQERNRQDAFNRLAALVAAALKPRPPRRPTRPTAASLKKRLAVKRRRSDLKKQRRKGRGEGEGE